MYMVVLSLMLDSTCQYRAGNCRDTLVAGSKTSLSDFSVNSCDRGHGQMAALWQDGFIQYSLFKGNTGPKCFFFYVAR